MTFQCGKGPAAVVKGVEVIGIGGERPIDERKGLAEFALSDVMRRDANQRATMIGPNRYRAAIGDQGFLDAIGFFQHIAQTAVRVGIVGAARDRAPETRLGLL